MGTFDPWYHRNVLLSQFVREQLALYATSIIAELEEQQKT